VVFTGTINTGAYTNDSAIAAGPLSNLVIAAREGMPAPQMPPEVVLTIWRSSGPCWGRAGTWPLPRGWLGRQSAAPMTPRSGPGRRRPLTMVCRRGSQATGLPPGVVYSTAFAGTFDPGRPQSPGNIAFIAYLEGPGVTNDNRQALWAGQPGLREPDPAAGRLSRLGRWRAAQRSFALTWWTRKGNCKVSGGEDEAAAAA